MTRYSARRYQKPFEFREVATEPLLKMHSGTRFEVTDTYDGSKTDAVWFADKRMAMCEACGKALPAVSSCAHAKALKKEMLAALK